MQQEKVLYTKHPLRLAIHQPNFLPRLKVLQKLAYADVWCVLDSVQFCTREWQNRARIVQIHGDNQVFWLTVPVQRPFGQSTLINKVKIIEPSSTFAHIEQTLYHALHRAPYWKGINELIPIINGLKAPQNLTELCIETTLFLLNLANRQPQVLLSSSLPVEGKASNLMAKICSYLKATTYLADSGARNYLQMDYFSDIEIVWQNWCEPEEKWSGINLWRNMSGINYLCRVGPDKFARHLVKNEFTIEKP